MSPEPRLLLLVTTSSYRAGAFVEAAARLDVAVIVGSDQPLVVGGVHPGAFLTLDFGAPERGVAAIVEHARAHPIAAVVAADDEGTLLAARAAAALGLRHHPPEAVAAARDKQRTRERLRAAAVPSPDFEVASLAEDPGALARRVRMPCVLKPLFLSASRGVLRADDEASFVKAFERIARLLRAPALRAAGGALAERILVEDYVPGAEVALEGLVEGGSLRTLAIFDKPDPLEGPTFEETLYVTPSRLPRATLEAVGDCAARACLALGLTEGPVHSELRVNERGPWLIEVNPRSIGGLCSRALRFEGGRSLEELILSHALGRDPGALGREATASGVMMVPIPGEGTLREVRGMDEARAVEGVEEIRITIPIGHAVTPLPEGRRYLGFVFARAGTPERVEAALREAHRRLEFRIEP